MALPNAPRGGGPGRAYTHVPYVSTSKGERWRAWIAGPCQWFSCHCSTRTKPCLELLTGGELSCSICSPTKVPQVIGYQPLYRELDGRPVHVIVYELQRELVEKFRLHQAVVVGRHIEATDTVFITAQLTGGRPYTSTLAERMRPLDLTETLLKMWNMPLLTSWYRDTHGKDDAPAVSFGISAPVPAPPAQQTTPGPAPVSDNALSHANRILDGDPRTINDTVDLLLGERAPEVEALARRRDAIRRGEEAARNGKHKPTAE